jgi:hypothetical protein
MHGGLQGKYHHLGMFRDPVEAAKCYDREAIKLQGPRALLNFPPHATPTEPYKHSQPLEVTSIEGRGKGKPAPNVLLRAGNAEGSATKGLLPGGDAETHTAPVPGPQVWLPLVWSASLLLGLVCNI